MSPRRWILISTAVVALGVVACGRGLTWSSGSSAQNSGVRLLNASWFDMSGLVGYWPLEESSIQNGFSVLNLSIHPLVTTFTSDNGFTEKSVKARVGRGLETDDNGDQISVSNATPLNVPAGTDFSVMFWAKASVVNTAQNFLCKGNNFSVSTDGASRLEFSYFDGAAWHIFQTDDGPLTYDWIHVAVTFRMPSGSTAPIPAIYANGAELPGTWVSGGPSPYLPSPQINSNPLTLSACNGLSFFSGILDDVSLWNRLLSVSEISQAYSYQSGSQ